MNLRLSVVQSYPGNIRVVPKLNVCDLTAAESKLMSNNEAKWKDEIHCKPKLRFYKQFKHNFGTEHYLLHNSLNIKQRSYLSQLSQLFLFRCPTHNVQRNIWFATMQGDWKN